MDDLDYAETMKSLQADYQKAREQVSAMQQGLTGATASVRAKNRKVSATVDARGRLTELSFHGQGYRAMAPPDLAKLIMETVNQAHEEAQRELWKSAASFLPAGASLDAVVSGDFDWASTLSDQISLPKLVQDMLERSNAGRPSSGAEPDRS